MPGTASDALSLAPALEAGPARLVPFSRRHLTERYVAWLNDPAAMRFSENRHRRHDLAGCTAYAEGFRKGPSLLWAIETPDLGHVGNVSASIDATNRNADIGILLGESAIRGRGLGLAVWSAVLGHLLTREDLDKVTGGCLASNHAMIRIMERAGMRPDGCRPRHYLWEGTRTDLVYFARFRGA